MTIERKIYDIFLLLCLQDLPVLNGIALPRFQGVPSKDIFSAKNTVFDLTTAPCT